MENYCATLMAEALARPLPACWIIFRAIICFCGRIPHYRATGGRHVQGRQIAQANPCGLRFRLPSALDNRPLKFDEFSSMINQVVYVSATPGKYELDQSQGIIAEQIIRPTGLVDPEVEVRQTKGRWKTCFPNAAPGWPGAKESWLPRLPSAWPKI